MKVKELKEILQECNEDMEVRVEYCGLDIELYKGDCLEIKDYNASNMAIYLEFK